MGRIFEPTKRVDCRHIRYRVRHMWIYVDEECTGEKELDRINGTYRVWNSECLFCRSNRRGPSMFWAQGHDV